MTDNPNVAVAIRYFEALTRKDPRAAPLAPDVVLESPITPKLHGVAQVLEYLEALASVARAIRTLDFIAEGNKVAVQFELETAAGVIPGFECLEVSNGLISKVRPYYLDSRPLLDGPAPNSK
jgi:ketosteroid isomerase-like protein